MLPVVLLRTIPLGDGAILRKEQVFALAAAGVLLTGCAKIEQEESQPSASVATATTQLATEAETVPSEPEPAPETEELDIETLERMRESENAEKETGAEADAPAGEAETELIDGKLYYEIQEGDNLWQVAEKLLGAGGRFQEIAQANDLEEPYDLMPGEKLLIPAA